MKRVIILVVGLLVMAGLAGPARAHHPRQGAVDIRVRPPVTAVVVVHGPVIRPHPFHPVVIHPARGFFIPRKVFVPGTVVAPVAPVWVPGFWRWDGVRWVWVSGHWAWWW